MFKIIPIVMLLLVGCVQNPQGTSDRTAVLLTAVKPAYPLKAFKERQSGRVKMKYDVDSSGNVDNVRVLSVSPSGYGFEKESAAALSGWKYEPGKPARDLNYTFRFSISSDVKTVY